VEVFSKVNGENLKVKVVKNNKEIKLSIITDEDQPTQMKHTLTFQKKDKGTVLSMLIDAYYGIKKLK